MTKTTHDPQWWRPEYDVAWEQTRESFHRDWERIERDFSVDEPELEAGATEGNDGPTATTHEIPYFALSRYDEMEQASRFGFGSRLRYENQFRSWGPDLEAQLESDWFEEHPDNEGSWERFREAIHRGWHYGKN